MKTIGMLGGMSWESTISYYKAVNTGIKKALGGLHSAKICMVSVDFDEIEKLQNSGDWEGAGKILSEASLSIEKGGADFLIICTNTMHKVIDQIEACITIPVLHIADATAETLLKDGIKRVGLLGTRFTMEQAFYSGRLSDKHAIQVVIPNENDRSLVHKVIYEELCLGNVDERSKQAYLEVIKRLEDQGAQAIILGCTEIGLLLSQEDTKMPLYDTAAIHAKAAVKMALEK